MRQEEVAPADRKLILSDRCGHAAGLGTTLNNGRKCQWMTVAAKMTIWLVYADSEYHD